MTKTEIIATLKVDFPEIKVMENGIERILNTDEYETIIQEWAMAKIAKLENEKIQAAKEAQKIALLDRLGITAEEAVLLLS